MRWMRELGALSGALVTALALLLLGAPPSVAGGPTSVLLVSPTSSETASLYNAQKEYGVLERLLGRTGGELDRSREERPNLDETPGHTVNVTWLIHDVRPWRVDQVYPLTPSSRGVWIHTTMGVPNGSNGIWHKADRPEELRALLTKLGVMGKAPEGHGDALVDPPSTDNGATAPTADDRQPTEAATTDTDLGTNWWWAIPGLAVGAVLTLTVRPLTARAGWKSSTGRRTWWSHRREPGPRQELRDS